MFQRSCPPDAVVCNGPLPPLRWLTAGTPLACSLTAGAACCSSVRTSFHTIAVRPAREYSCLPSGHFHDSHRFVARALLTWRGFHLSIDSAPTTWAVLLLACLRVAGSSSLALPIVRVLLPPNLRHSAPYVRGPVQTPACHPSPPRSVPLL